MRAPYIIAEIGSNHDGQFERAINLIHLAAESGANAVKFQLFRADSLSRNRGAADYWSVYKANEMPDSWLPSLAEAANRNGVEFLCTAYDPWGVDAVFPHVEKFKVASFEMRDHKLLAYIAQHDKKVILSTGMSTMKDIMESIQALGIDNVAHILHCVSAYPAPDTACQLSVIDFMGMELSEYYGTHVSIGLSDHTEGMVAPIVATAFGAECIEKHFTDNRSRVGPDHRVSIEPTEFSQMVEGCWRAWNMVGDGHTKEPQEAEKKMMCYRVNKEGEDVRI